MTFTIEGPPRTKKNHGRRIKRGKRIFSVPSEAHEEWAASAIRQLQKQSAGRHTAVVERVVYSGRTRVKVPVKVVFAELVNVRALIYREANTGDATGYYQAIGDALEAAGVVANDKLIESWDGSRRLIDRKRPRVEIELTPAT